MKKIILIALALGLISNVAYNAYDSHMNPEGYKRCVKEELVFWWE